MHLLDPSDRFAGSESPMTSSTRWEECQGSSFNTGQTGNLVLIHKLPQDALSLTSTCDDKGLRQKCSHERVLPEIRSWLAKTWPFL